MVTARVIDPKSGKITECYGHDHAALLCDMARQDNQQELHIMESLSKDYLQTIYDYVEVLKQRVVDCVARLEDGQSKGASTGTNTIKVMRKSIEEYDKRLETILSYL